jgi:hypothetical protein
MGLALYKRGLFKENQVVDATKVPNIAYWRTNNFGEQPFGRHLSSNKENLENPDKFHILNPPIIY